MTSSDYDPKYCEEKWQKYWLANKTFKTIDDFSKKKFYILDMFPYPSGAGLHVGHPEGYTATDIVARYKRMLGFNVLHPMGWDAFGLPAEQYAIQTGTHPRITTAKNISRFREQIQALGLSYDWDREIDTTNPEYYKWTQWIFLQLYKKGLAYESFEPVNWCPALGTVLANEEVVDGKSERGGHPVIRKPMRQWVLKITAYAERLLDDLKLVDWPESIKNMQRNWIGKSKGAEIVFAVAEKPGISFEVFTTRPDTLFGATFCVLAPEHPIIPKITANERRDEVLAYIAQAQAKSEIERSTDEKEKTGVFTGSYAINPANGKNIPIFVSDYVLLSYGKGAIMAVPGHDVRDHAFAKKYDLPIVRVIDGGNDENILEGAHTGPGTLINSQFLNGLDQEAAFEKMCKWLEENSKGKGATKYKLRDWLFSRQRYWGEPFPLAHNADGDIVLFDEADLPVTLPELDAFQPTGTGESPLALATSWLQVEKNGVRLRRETNTMPQWAGSCWYYLRFIDPKNNAQPWDPEKEKYWMPVDLYVGGAEHAVLHLLYARFWHKVLYDCGCVSTPEPFKKLVNQGMILGENGEKMSKSRGNVVNPDDVVRDWGADSLRLYEMFMGPLEATKPWNSSAIPGVHRFLKRVWRLIIDEQGAVRIGEWVNEDIEAALHRTIRKVTIDIDALSFNTAIASMMEFVNAAYKSESPLTKSQAERFVLILSPFSPHIAEELWQLLGHKATLAYEPWPVFDEKMCEQKMVTISVQVNGKLRATLELAVGVSKEQAIFEAKRHEGVLKHISGKKITKEIYVPGKIINFVV